ncbi:MAG: hypothetical protein QF609_01865 [Gammaproteobacteria bacterium]|jgi:hypothetical protein|nr:hypothetical protein [Gammaproteobacteria bacterium]
MNANLEQASLFRLALAENQGLAKLWVEGLQNYDSIDGAHKARFDSLIAQRFWIWTHIFDRMTNGVSGTNNWASAQYQIEQFLESPGARRWWTINHGQYPREFVDEINNEFRGVPGTVYLTMPNSLDIWLILEIRKLSPELPDPGGLL